MPVICYKIWEYHKKIEKTAINHYDNLLALLDSDGELFIYDLLCKKCIFTFHTRNLKLETEDFIIQDVQFSKNSNFIALSLNIQNEKQVLLLHLNEKIAEVKKIYYPQKSSKIFLMDPNNKYLFFELLESSLVLKDFQDLYYFHKFFEFLEEIEEEGDNEEEKKKKREEKFYSLNYLQKISTKKEKILGVALNKKLFFLKCNILKEGRTIVNEKVDKLMEINITFANPSKIIFNKKCDTIFILGANKQGPGYHLNYKKNENSIHSIIISDIQLQDNDCANIHEAFFYAFHSKFSINEEYFLQVSSNSSQPKQAILKFNSLKDSSSINHQINQINLETKIIPYKFLNISYWDGSFLGFFYDKEKSSHYIMVFEFETPPTWVNLGFKFKCIENNIEYQEQEDEFDKKCELKQENNKEVQISLNSSNINDHKYYNDMNIFHLIKKENTKKEKDPKLMEKISKRMNLSFI